MHSNALSTGNALLPAWYYDAFTLRFLGYKYKDIAERTGKAEDTIKKLFAKSGALYKYWRDYVEVRKSEHVEESMDMLYGRLPDSVRTLIVHAVQGKGLVSLEAIRTHMAYTMGKPEDRIKLDATVGIFNFSDWALAEAEKLKKENGQGEQKTERVAGVSEGS